MASTTVGTRAREPSPRTRGGAAGGDRVATVTATEAAPGGGAVTGAEVGKANAVAQHNAVVAGIAGAAEAESDSGAEKIAVATAAGAAAGTAAAAAAAAALRAGVRVGVAEAAAAAAAAEIGRYGERATGPTGQMSPGDGHRVDPSAHPPQTEPSRTVQASAFTATSWGRSKRAWILQAGTCDPPPQGRLFLCKHVLYALKASTYQTCTRPMTYTYTSRSAIHSHNVSAQFFAVDVMLVARVYV